LADRNFLSGVCSLAAGAFGCVRYIYLKGIWHRFCLIEAGDRFTGASDTCLYRIPL